MTDFAARVRHEMERRGLATTKVAKMADVSQTSVWRLVNEDAALTLKVAARIARALEIPLDNADSLPHCDADEAWSKFYNATDPAFRQYMFRDQFIAGFEAGRSS